MYVRTATTLLLSLFGTVLAAGLAVPSSALAQRQEQDTRARELFLEGEAHYAAGRYEDAARDYERAYELSQRPELLFNLGNAYERMGEYEKAAEYLREYLNSPRARDIVSVRERIRRLETAAEEARRQKEAEREAAQRALAAQSQEPSTSGKADKSVDPAVWWLAGSGVAAVGTVVFAVLANGAASDAEADCANTSGGGLVCDQDASSALTRETVFSVSADVSAVVALATAGVGLYLLFTGDDGEAAPGATAARLTPTLMPNGAGIGLSGRF